MADIIVWEGITKHDLPVERVLGAAAEANLEYAVVLGHTLDGDFYFASSRASGADIVWDMELAKKKLLDIADD